MFTKYVYRGLPFPILLVTAALIQFFAIAVFV